MLVLLFSLLFAAQAFGAPAPDAPSDSTTTPSTTTSGMTDSVEESRTIAGGVEDILDFDFAPRFTVGNKDILQVDMGNTPTQIRVYPKKPGVSSVTVIDPQGKVRKKLVYNVIKTDLSQKVQAIRDLLFDVEGITVKAVDEKIVVDGELIVPRDLDRIMLVQQAYPEVLNLVTLSKMSREMIARRMQKEINDDAGGINISVRLVNDTFFLLGTVESDVDRMRAQTIAETYLPEVLGSVATKEGTLVAGVKKVAIRNLISVQAEAPPPPQKMVRVTWHFVEMTKNFLDSSLFKWNPLYTDAAGIKFGVDSATGQIHTSGGSSFTGTISNLLPKLQSGAASGFARVLHSAVGVGLNNQKITLRKGQKVPYISGVQDGTPVTAYADASINFQVLPSIQDNEVDLDDTVEISVPASGGSPGASPAINTTTYANHIRVKSGESAVLGGLISNDMTKDVNKDPTEDTGAVSGLFKILRSKAFTNNKSQFVVFITPQIIEDAAQGTADIKRKFINNKKKRLRPID